MRAPGLPCRARRRNSHRLTSMSVQEMVALTPLLTTKLHIPRRRRVLVGRPRLSARLSRGNEVPLTLVSAPAGFGKTTVLTEWLAADPPDNVRWRGSRWTSATTIRPCSGPTSSPRCGPLTRTSARDALDAPAVLADVERVLAALLNDLVAARDDVVLVLDDYHVIDSAEVQDGMAFLLEHLPAQVHLVIASRADPALPLARLRAPRRARRGARRGSAVHAGRGRRLSQRGDGTRPDGRGRRRAGGTHRGMDRRAAAGGAVDAGPDDVAGVHRGLRRGRPLHRRLPGRGSAAAPAGTRPDLPAADVHPGPVDRTAVRRRHRPGRRQGHAGGARQGEPVPDPAGRSAPLVPLPPPVRRRAARAPARGAARRWWRSCTDEPDSGTKATASWPRPSPTRSPPATSGMRPT